jgi:hypothetical protein
MQDSHVNGNKLITAEKSLKKKNFQNINKVKENGLID